jgi:hypothetical protein
MRLAPRKSNRGRSSGGYFILASILILVSTAPAMAQNSQLDDAWITEWVEQPPQYVQDLHFFRDSQPLTSGEFAVVSPSRPDPIPSSILLDSNLTDPVATSLGTVPSAREGLWQRIKSDHAKYYDPYSLTLLAGGFLAGAAVANTQLDQQIQTHFQSSVRDANSDDWFESLHASKEMGNGKYTLPVFAMAWAAGEIFDDSPTLTVTGQWGERSLRSFVVGAPPLIVAQRLTGGSRPGETPDQSRWQPFQDNNGVSGHAFMSALPFINAAKLTKRPLLKATFYAGSLLGPLSRINDDAHYSSQVALGWWMAYVAATAIDRTEQAGNKLAIHPYLSDDGAAGGMFEWRF